MVLEAKQPGRYEGRYTDPDNARSGTLQLKWSRVERRFNGTWEEGDDRNGKISIRLDGDQIRGAWRTSRKSKLGPGTPRLADLLWAKKRESLAHTKDGEPEMTKSLATRVGTCSQRDDMKTFTKRAAFVACLKQPLRTVDFDDIDTSQPDPVPFDSKRYAASAGIVITGEAGQYADESFACPRDFIPSSSPNILTGPYCA